jgi:hypothetical protein
MKRSTHVIADGLSVRGYLLPGFLLAFFFSLHPAFSVVTIGLTGSPSSLLKMKTTAS